MPCEQARDLTSYITAYAPLLAVFVAIGVALMQYYLQKQQLKQDLYDKRFRVFYAIQKVLSQPEVPPDPSRFLTDLERETAEAGFLFSHEIKYLIQEIGSTLNALSHAYVQRTAPVPQPDAGTHEYSDIEAKFYISLPVKVERFFAPYLQLYHEQGWFAWCKARAEGWMETEDTRLNSRYRRPGRYS